MTLDPGSATPTGRAAVVKMVAGGGIVLAGFALFISGGIAEVRPFVPLGAMAGMVLLGLGLHTWLWSGPRATSRVPPGLRSLVSAAAAFGIVMLVAVVLGFGVGLARRQNVEAGRGWTDRDRAYFEQSCLKSWVEGDLGGSGATAASYCACWGSYAEKRFPVLTEVRFDARDPEILAARQRFAKAAVK